MRLNILQLWPSLAADGIDDMRSQSDLDPGNRSPLVLESTGERMVPESSDSSTFWEHVYRYAFASHFVQNKRVLDIACGEGYGAAALQTSGASRVIGVDVSESVCLHVREKYGLDARPGNAELIPLADSSVDVVVSFETIEHVPDPLRFLDECARVLSLGGLLIISTPNKGIYAAETANPYHCSEMTEHEFTSALASRFSSIRFYTQCSASAAWWSMRSLSCVKSPWIRIPGFWRARSLAQRMLAPEAVGDPTEKQRAAASDLILQVARNPHKLLNPFALRPRHKWIREEATYIISTATRGESCGKVQEHAEN